MIAQGEMMKNKGWKGKCRKKRTANGDDKKKIEKWRTKEEKFDKRRRRNRGWKGRNVQEKEERIRETSHKEGVNEDENNEKKERRRRD